MESKRWPLMVAKYGSEEAARAEMRRRAENSARNKGKQGGFHALKRDDPQKFKEIASRGGKKTAQKQSQTSSEKADTED